MSLSVRTDQPQPTWKSGFDPSSFDPAHPELWEGLILAASMGLGPTGIATLRDTSGFKNDLSLVGSMTGGDWVIGDGRYALDFDGSDDRGEIATNSVIDLTGTGVALSVWMNAVNFSSTRFLIGKGTYGDNGGYQIEIRTSGAIRFLIPHSGASDDFYDTGVSVVIAGTWHHIVATYNGVEVVIYVDGVAENTTAETRNISTTPQKFSIGEYYNGTAPFLGLIDEGLLYKRGLTHSEVSKLWQIKRGGILQRRPIVVAKAPAAVGGTILPQIISAYYRINA